MPERPSPLFFCETPFGPAGLAAAADGSALTGFFFSPQGGTAALVSAPPLVRRARRQLEEYFSGRRQVFDLPLAPAGTDFQRRVWAVLAGIPYGRTLSYREVAEKAGSPRAFRAAGQACARNPIAIVIPCHRVVGHNGALTGFAGGLDIKAALLKLETP